MAKAAKKDPALTPEEKLAQAEEALLRQIITAYDLDTSHIVYDATNFLTYIDTANESCTRPTS